MSTHQSLSKIMTEFANDPDKLAAFKADPEQFLATLSNDEADSLQSILGTSGERSLVRITSDNASLFPSRFYMGADEGSTIYQLSLPDIAPDQNATPNPIELETVQDSIPRSLNQTETTTEIQYRLKNGGIQLEAIQLYNEVTTGHGYRTYHDVTLESMEFTMVMEAGHDSASRSLMSGYFYVNAPNSDSPNEEIVYQLISTHSGNPLATGQRIPLYHAPGTPPNVYQLRDSSTPIGAAQILPHTSENSSYHNIQLTQFNVDINPTPRGPYITKAWLQQGNGTGAAILGLDFANLNNIASMKIFISGDITPAIINASYPASDWTHWINLTSPSGGTVIIQVPGGYFPLNYSSADYNGTSSM